MELLAKVTLSNPEGWVNLFFDENTSNIKCYLLEIDFVKMQDNGKDCHIRQVIYFVHLDQHIRTKI